MGIHQLATKAEIAELRNLIMARNNHLSTQVIGAPEDPELMKESKQLIQELQVTQKLLMKENEHINAELNKLKSTFLKLDQTC
jgi:hypothetical protein